MAGPSSKEINKAKLDDIKSIMHLTSADAHEFYTNFTGNAVMLTQRLIFNDLTYWPTHQNRNSTFLNTRFQSTNNIISKTVAKPHQIILQLF